MTSRPSRRLGFAFLGAVLGLTVSAAAFAQAVLQSVTVRVEPGKMEAYLERIDQLQGVMDRLGGGARIGVWQATLAGAGSGNTLIGVSHPSLAAFAETTMKTGADAEWQTLFGGLDEFRTVVSNGLLVSRDGGGAPEPPGDGAVLQGVIVRVKPGKLDDYLAQVEALRKVRERVGSSGNMRVFQATVAGEGTGNVAVGITYPSLAAWAVDSGKLRADAEGQKIFAGLDEIRTVLSSSLFASQ